MCSSVPCTESFAMEKHVIFCIFVWYPLLELSSLSFTQTTFFLILCCDPHLRRKINLVKNTLNRPKKTTENSQKIFQRSDEYFLHALSYLYSAQTPVSFSTLGTSDWARQLETSSLPCYNLQLLCWILILWRTLSGLLTVHSNYFYQLPHNIQNLSFQNG